MAATIPYLSNVNNSIIKELVEKEFQEKSKVKEFLEAHRLLEKINIKTEDNGENIVYHAIRLGAQPDLVEALLALSKEKAEKERGILTSAANEIYDFTPVKKNLLAAAIEAGNQGTICYLLSKMNVLSHDIQKYGESPLIALIQNGLFHGRIKDMFEKKLKEERDTYRISTPPDILNKADNSGKKPIHDALMLLENQKISEVEAKATIESLIASGAKVDGAVLLLALRSNTEFGFAFLDSQLEILNKIIKDKHDIYSKTWLGGSEKQELVSSLEPLTYKDKDGCTLLHRISQDGSNPKKSIERVQIILNLLNNDPGKSININTGDARGRTPLFYAIRAGNLELVKLLIDKGADPTLASGKRLNGMSSIHWAARNGQLEILKYLLTLTRKVNPTAQDTLGRTMFHHAALGGHQAILEYLLNNEHTRQIVNTPNKKGRLPLHSAARNGRIEAVRYLLNTVPYQLILKDKNGENPITLAYRKGRMHIGDNIGIGLSGVIELLLNRWNRGMQTAYPTSITVTGNHSSSSSSSVIVNSSSDQFFINKELDELSRHTKESGISPLRETIFTSASYLASFVHRDDLSNGMLEPIMNRDGTISLHRVKFIYNSDGIRCLMLIPEESPKTDQPKDVKIIFLGPKTQKETLEQLKSESSERNAPIIAEKIMDIALDFKTPVRLNLIGHGLGGVDAQCCMHRVLERIHARKENLPPESQLALVTINSPGVNPTICERTLELVSALKPQIKRIENHRLSIEGNYVSTIGEDNFLLGKSNSTSQTEQDSSQGVVHNYRAFSKEEKLTDEMDRYEREIERLEDENEKLKKEFEQFEKNFGKTLSMLESERDMLNEEYRTAPPKSILTLLSRHKEFLKEEKRKVREKINTLKAIDNKIIANNWSRMKADQRLKELSSVCFENRSLETFRDGVLRFNSTSSENLQNVYQRNTIPLPKVFKPHPVTPLMNLTLASASETKTTFEVSKLATHGIKHPKYEELRKKALNYIRGKSKDNFEKIYAAGEYVFHDLEYEKDFKKNQLVPMLTDEGEVVDYRVHPLVELRGMKSCILVPENGKGDVKIFFMGTDPNNIDSVHRDLSTKGAGFSSFKAKAPALLAQINQILGEERGRIFKQHGKASELTSLTIGGHSLGGADAQYCYTLMMKAIAANRAAGLENAAEVNDEPKRTAESNGITPKVDLKNTLDQLLTHHEIISPDIRNNIRGFNTLRLQAYNAPAVNFETVDEALALARYLHRTIPPLKLQAQYQRVDIDIVQRMGEAHVFESCPNRYADVEVLKFNNFGQSWIPSLSIPDRLAAHQKRHFEAAPVLDSNKYEIIRNDHHGHMRNKNGANEFNDKLKSEENSLSEIAMNTIKGGINALVSRYQTSERGPGLRS